MIIRVHLISIHSIRFVRSNGHMVEELGPFSVWNEIRALRISQASQARPDLMISAIASFAGLNDRS